MGVNVGIGWYELQAVRHLQPKAGDPAV